MWMLHKEHARVMKERIICDGGNILAVRLPILPKSWPHKSHNRFLFKSQKFLSS